jgi:flagellar motor switch protein FliG
MARAAHGPTRAVASILRQDLSRARWLPSRADRKHLQISSLQAVSCCGTEPVRELFAERTANGRHLLPAWGDTMEYDDANTQDKEELRREEDIDLTPRERAAILMVALGEEAAGEVMKYLGDFEIEELTQTITELESLPTSLQDQVLQDFEQHLLAGEWVNQGGAEFARAALERAVGPRRAEEILDRVLTNVTSGFYMLRNVAPEQIAPFISNEHPQTIALILSQLDSTQAAGILGQLPGRVQAEVAYRIATLDNITPAVLKQVEESLETNLKDLLGGNKAVGGPKIVADMLNLTGTSVEKGILERLDSQDPEVAETVRNMMFVFEDIVTLTDRELQTMLREVEQKDLVVALKAASEELKSKVLGNMSDRVRSFIQEEMEFMGPTRLSEVEEVQLRIVQKVRQLEEQGQISIMRGASEDTFV